MHSKIKHRDGNVLISEGSVLRRLEWVLWGIDECRKWEHMKVGWRADSKSGSAEN